MRRLHFVMVTVFALTIVALPTTADAKEKIAVLDLRVNTEIDKGVITTLNEILLNSFHESGALDVLGSSDIATMITLEEERVKLTGCADDACLAEIGGALGVQLLASASIGAVGDKYVLSVKVIDVKKAMVVDRSSETVAKEDSELIAAIKRAVKKVTATVKVTYPPSGEARALGEPSGFIEIAPWVGLGLTIALGGTGGILGGLAWSDAASAREEFEGTSDWQDLKDSTDSKAVAADVMFGIAGAAAVATIVLFILDASGDDEPAASTAVVPTRGGGVASVEVRF